MIQVFQDEGEIILKLIAHTIQGANKESAKVTTALRNVSKRCMT